VRGEYDVNAKHRLQGNASTAAARRFLSCPRFATFMKKQKERHRKTANGQTLMSSGGIEIYENTPYFRHMHSISHHQTIGMI
jgi:hypothetical protein